MEFQLSYFKSWKMMLWKYCTQYTSKSGKLTCGHRTGKGQSSFQSQRKAVPKNVQTTTHTLISHTSKVMLRILQARLQQNVNCELPDVQAGFKKAEESDIKLPTSAGSSKSKRVPEKHLLLLYRLCQSLWLSGSQQTVENSLKKWEYQTNLPAFWEICMQVKNQ